MHADDQAAESLHLARRLMKRALIRETMNVEADIFPQRMVSPEAKEAFAAFVEKRKPNFSKFARKTLPDCSNPQPEGRVAARLNAPVLKTGKGENLA